MAWAMTAREASAQADLLALLPRLRRYARVLAGTHCQADLLVVATLSCARDALRSRASAADLPAAK